MMKRIAFASILLGCDAASSTVTFRAAEIPSDTISVNMSTTPDDTCFKLPLRYSPAVAAEGVVLPRSCFGNEATYTFEVFTYARGCCTFARGTSVFQGYLDPRSRVAGPSIEVTAVLSTDTPPVCNSAAMCGPS